MTAFAEGIPEIPDVLVALTGISAATYVSNKAVLTDSPSLTALSRPVGG